MLVCPTGWTGFQNHCYKLSDQKLMWNKARLHCKSMSSNLVSIHSRDEWNFIKNHIISQLRRSSNDIWTGGYKVDHTWAWEDGSTFGDWTYWEKTQPNGQKNQCMYLRGIHGFQWFDTNYKGLYEVKWGLCMKGKWNAAHY